MTEYQLAAIPVGLFYIIGFLAILSIAGIASDLLEKTGLLDKPFSRMPMAQDYYETELDDAYAETESYVQEQPVIRAVRRRAYDQEKDFSFPAVRDQKHPA